MKEKWMPIKNYEGFYEVSDKGRVRSLDRYVNGKHKNKAFRKGRVLKPEKVQAGYYRVELQKNGFKKRLYVHRLVADSFIPNPHNKPQVNHINSMRDDNIVYNLEWVTPKENIIHGVEHGDVKYGENHPKSKLSKKRVLEILELKKGGMYPKGISEVTGINISTVGNIYYKKAWVKFQKDLGVI